jgi:hypothetical protein
MGRGDHVYVCRGRRYTHHGIDCGDGTVIHYVQPRIGVRHVARTSREVFAASAEVKVRAYAQRLPPEQTVRYAESRIGSVGYHLVRNNCEHFAAWCCTGRATSRQVRRWALATHGTFAWLVAFQTLGTNLVALGAAGAGLLALSRPRRRA